MGPEFEVVVDAAGVGGGIDAGLLGWGMRERPMKPVAPVTRM
ncbi:MAG: hypothetical protein M5U34_28780 [Chloroflexi bacterium]|nr:hypothetical protein [Chloroflexota bacterium]